MHVLGVMVIMIAGILWIVGGRAIMRPQVRRPGGQSLISMLRPSPISLKDFTPDQKLHQLPQFENIETKLLCQTQARISQPNTAEDLRQTKISRAAAS
jgi:hypothetical protein